MIDDSIFPHFIPDIPKGLDAFEGRSQEKLANNICEYMRKVDAKADTKDGIRIPRIIGLEGGWGIGKSNVVRMISNTMDDESTIHSLMTLGGIKRICSVGLSSRP